MRKFEQTEMMQRSAVLKGCVLYCMSFLFVKGFLRPSLTGLSRSSKITIDHSPFERCLVNSIITQIDY